MLKSFEALRIISAILVVMGAALQKRVDVTPVLERSRGFLASRVSKIFPLYVVATLWQPRIAPARGRALSTLRLNSNK